MSSQIHHHHIHKRKRVHQKLEKYPHPNPWINFLDRLLIVLAVIGPMTNIPQIAKIYIEKNASGLSLLSWLLYFFLSIPWILYGIVHKEKPIIISSSLWAVTDFIVIIGILLYA
jgi:uncharacterized protein with PQ loop repeat